MNVNILSRSEITAEVSEFFDSFEDDEYIDTLKELSYEIYENSFDMLMCSDIADIKHILRLSKHDRWSWIKHIKHDFSSETLINVSDMIAESGFNPSSAKGVFIFINVSENILMPDFIGITDKIVTKNGKKEDVCCKLAIKDQESGHDHLDHNASYYVLVSGLIKLKEMSTRT